MHTNPLNALVVVLFSNPMTAIWISVALLLWCALIIERNGRLHHRPVSRALRSRIAALDFIREAESEEDAQRELASRFFEVNEAMTSGGKGTVELRQAWAQFRETILDETEVPLRMTVRPEGYFLHLGDDTRVLAWWANIFVAMGLTFTFLGIVAALTSTVTALNSAGGTGNMTPALISLLTITSVKFWTSIAGVLASIILRWFDRRWHSSTINKLEAICDRLERGTLFSPNQRFAAEQLRETREQTATLKTFSHELAVAIGENFERQMQPMISVLGGIQTSIDDFKSGSFNQIGKELGEALSRQAGTEMAQLGAALGEMTTKLSSIHEQLDGSGKAANEQIATAAKDFAQTSDRMNQMFASLHERVEASGSRINDAANEASQQALGRFSEASAGIQDAFDKMRGEIADYGQRLTAGADSAAERNADVLSKAAAVLEGAAAKASVGMNDALDSAIARASEESARAISAAFATFGERFDAASAGLVDTLRTTAGRMEALSEGMDRFSRSSDENATRLAQAGIEAQGIAQTLTRAASDLQGAAAPIKSASEIIGNAVSRTSETIEKHTDAAARHQNAMADIGGKLTETTESATRAWSEYRGRFEDVDRALTSAINQISSTSADHAAHLNEQVGKVDNALAGAVDKLSAALDPLTELADRIEDLLGRLQAAS